MVMVNDLHVRRLQFSDAIVSKKLYMGYIDSNKLFFTDILHMRLTPLLFGLQKAKEIKFADNNNVETSIRLLFVVTYF